MIHRHGTVALSPVEIVQELHMYMDDEQRHLSRLLKLLPIVFLPDDARRSLPKASQKFVELQSDTFREFERTYKEEASIVYRIHTESLCSSTDHESGKFGSTIPGLHSPASLAANDPNDEDMA